MISVIIPMFNSENTIEACISSVLNQTFNGSIEIIVVNDGSFDDSKSIVEELRSKYSKYLDIILIDKTNGGVSSARNSGLAACKGEYIALLDSDDEWLPDKLEKQMRLMAADNSIDFLGCLISKPVNCKHEFVEVPLSKLIFKNYFQPSTVIFKREVFESIGFFDESQKYAEEGNYFMRVSKKFKCVLLNLHLVVYGQGKSGFGERGLSANLKEMEKGELRNLKFALRNNYISSLTYYIAVYHSLLKYFRRIFLSKLRYLCWKSTQ